MDAARQGFSREYRLTRPEEYRHVSRRARRLSSECFTVLLRENRLGRPRLGMAIARKHVRSAVRRNCVKRIIREGFRCRRERLGAYDMVFISRPTLARKNKQELHAIVDRVFKEIERCAAS
ncbi:MAG: ribonuclease P protein component [Gammaproteobacteria bacterium]